MERRYFLKLAFGFAAGGVALAVSAQAAPLMPAPLADDAKLPANKDAQPAVTSGDEVDRLTAEEVRWGRGRHRGWGRRRWGWRRRRWRRRYWGWHRRRRWRRRYWRRRRYYW
ncbi:twin-arginine translocation (Tat) [Bradyrhizobium sp. CSA112]|uniref:twin-arginine translocation (Tat) n=1 Tax=Bradyrhizobium sp. CSA112 TaxID=2699170 RepID=UPI0023B159D6|nr:twin-arginine translocation (Tat) [Bradyrhizobium sp. CSA112]MDE5452631.1 twin-arginine translocation (Tat) [Bradyrhizobium sp. CSA112]